MSRIDNLIQELCPDGVEFAELQAVFTTKGGYTPSKNDPTAWADGTVPWFRMEDIRDNGRVLGSSLQQINESAVKGGRLFPANSILVATSATIGEHALITVPHLSNQRFTSLTLKPEFVDRFEIKFVFYYCFVLNEWCRNNTTTSSFASVDMSGFKQFKFPVPPLEVQREIVRMLDKFTQLEAELEAELEARRAQYEHYRSQLLDGAGANAALVRLGDLGRIVTGRTPKSSDASAWGTEIDFVTPSDIRNGMKSVTTPDRRLSSAGMAAMVKAVIPANSLLVTCIGADMGKTVINANDCVTNQQINSIVPIKDVVVEYFFHLLTSMRERLRAQGERAGGTMPLINKTDFSKIEVPVPSLEVQKRVAAKLDDFDALVNDISIGLPAELAARRKQYEHYRDRLLTFKELAS